MRRILSLYFPASTLSQPNFYLNSHLNATVTSMDPYPSLDTRYAPDPGHLNLSRSFVVPASETFLASIPALSPATSGYVKQT
jgi:hypothetical protein